MKDIIMTADLVPGMMIYHPTMGMGPGRLIVIISVTSERLTVWFFSHILNVMKSHAATQFASPPAQIIFDPDHHNL